MTVFTKPNSMVIKKPVITSTFPISEKGVCNEEKVEILEDDEKQTKASILYISVVAILILVMGSTLGFLICRPAFGKTGRHYQGYCSILLPKDFREISFSQVDPDLHLRPLRFNDHDIQIISTDSDFDDKYVKGLREELDIGEMIERISVMNDGHEVNFIHDFNDNTTGIVDSERCWLMDLDPEFVLSPELFMDGLEEGGQLFDVSRVRDSLVAALPALARLPDTLDDLTDLTDLTDRCRHKPVYRLIKNDNIIEKRSVPERTHDYVQFAGRHVQEILIDNLAEVLDHEKKMQEEKEEKDRK